MATKTPPQKPAKKPAAKKPADPAPPRKRPGRPATGRTKATRSLAIDLDLLDWLESQTSESTSLSALVNGYLREAKDSSPRRR